MAYAKKVQEQLKAKLGDRYRPSRGYEKGWGSSDPGEGESKGEDRWED